MILDEKIINGIFINIRYIPFIEGDDKTIAIFNSKLVAENKKYIKLVTFANQYNKIDLKQNLEYSIVFCHIFSLINYFLFLEINKNYILDNKYIALYVYSRYNYSATIEVLDISTNRIVFTSSSLIQSEYVDYIVFGSISNLHSYYDIKIIGFFNDIDKLRDAVSFINDHNLIDNELQTNEIIQLMMSDKMNSDALDNIKLE